jgi:hypothetical protein
MTPDRQDRATDLVAQAQAVAALLASTAVTADPGAVAGAAWAVVTLTGLAQLELEATDV